MTPLVNQHCPQWTFPNLSKFPLTLLHAALINSLISYIYSAGFGYRNFEAFAANRPALANIQNRIIINK